MEHSERFADVDAKKLFSFFLAILTPPSDFKTYHFDAKFRLKDGRMSQNGGHHAIRRRKLPLENDLPDFFDDLPFLVT